MEIRQTDVFAHWVYFAQRGAMLIVLLCGGDKRTQRRDIEAARKLARALDEA